MIKMSLKFVPEGLIDNKSVLDQITGWYWKDAKPLSKPVMV